MGLTASFASINIKRTSRIFARSRSIDRHLSESRKRQEADVTASLKPAWPGVFIYKPDIGRAGHAINFYIEHTGDQTRPLALHFYEPQRRVEVQLSIKERASCGSWEL